MFISAKDGSWKGKQTNYSDVDKRYTPMTQEDIKVVSSFEGYFQTSNSFVVNEKLREGLELTPKEQKLVETLDKNMLPIDKDITVIRMADNSFLRDALGCNIRRDSIDKIKSKIVGGIVEERGFMSTSYDAKENIFKNRIVKMQIKAPKGTKGMFSPTGKEAEFLLARGTKYKITDVRYSNIANLNGDRQIIMDVEIVR